MDWKVVEVPKNYIYLDGTPYRVVNGSHYQALNFLKLEFSANPSKFRDSLIRIQDDEKNYFYTASEGRIKRFKSVCLSRPTLIPDLRGEF